MTQGKILQTTINHPLASTTPLYLKRSKEETPKQIFIGVGDMLSGREKGRAGIKERKIVVFQLTFDLFCYAIGQ